jgi:hypothetical protein
MENKTLTVAELIEMLEELCDKGYEDYEVCFSCPDTNNAYDINDVFGFCEPDDESAGVVFLTES